MNLKWLKIVVYAFITLSLLSLAEDFVGLTMLNSLEGAFESMFIQRCIYVSAACVAAWQLSRLKPWSLHAFAVVFVAGLIGDHVLGLFFKMGVLEYLLMPAIALLFGYFHRELLKPQRPDATKESH